MLNSVVEFTDEKWIFWLPICLMVCDVISGLIKGWVNKNVNSKIMRLGLAKKLCEMMTIVISIMAVSAINIPKSFVSLTSLYVCLTETVSIIENLDSIGVPIPNVIRNAIFKAKERS